MLVVFRVSDRSYHNFLTDYLTKKKKLVEITAEEAEKLVEGDYEKIDCSSKRGFIFSLISFFSACFFAGFQYEEAYQVAMGTIFFLAILIYYTVLLKFMRYNYTYTIVKIKTNI